jgi:hypothetical protein
MILRDRLRQGQVEDRVPGNSTVRIPGITQKL